MMATFPSEGKLFICLSAHLSRCVALSVLEEASHIHDQLSRATLGEILGLTILCDWQQVHGAILCQKFPGAFHLKLSCLTKFYTHFCEGIASLPPALALDSKSLIPHSLSGLLGNHVKSVCLSVCNF